MGFFLGCGRGKGKVSLEKDFLEVRLVEDKFESVESCNESIII